MKRLTLIVLSLAICVGVFAPVGLAVTERGSVAVGVPRASAQAVADGTSGGGASSDATSTSASVTLAADPTQNIPTCASITSLSFSIGACVAWLTYYIPYSVGQWFLGVAARTFDIAASFTLSSKLYTSGSFLQQGWQVTRDFANIFFILILLFIALSLTLDIEIGHANPKKLLASLVMVALVINFSFFITEVVIDLSNSLALVFYNQVTVVATGSNGQSITIDDKDLNEQLTNATGKDAQGHSVQYIADEKPLSVALVQAMKPQILSSNDFYVKLCNDRFYASPDATKQAKCADNASNSGMLIALFLIVGIMFIVTGYCFIVALGSLFGRMVSLFIAIIFAPIAFISLIVPTLSHQPLFGWDDWFSSLMKNAFAAPIFFFFILLISILSKSTIIPNVTTNLSAGVILLLVTIQFLILITMLLAATKYVKSASGAIGAALGGVAGAVVKGLGGLAVGTAAGGLAIAGQKTFGLVGAKLAKNDTLNKWATSENKYMRGFSKTLMQAGQGVSKASFNIGKPLAAVTGLRVDSFGAFSQKRLAGGLEGDAAYRAKKATDFANTIKENQASSKKLKDLKDAREKDVSEVEGKLFKFEAEETELKAQKAIRKEALEMIKRLKEEKVSPNDFRYKKAEEDLAASEAKLNGKRLTDGSPVVDAKGNAVDEGMLARAEANRKEIAQLKAKLTHAKTGMLDDNGKPLEYKNDDIGRDGKDGRPEVRKADGTLVTAEDVKLKRVRTESLSLKDIETLIESNKKANSRAYLYQEAVSSGAYVHANYDKVGNIKDFHVDSSQNGENQWSKVGMRAFGKALVLGGIGAAIAGPVGLAMGVANGAFLQGLQELFNKASGQAAGYSYTEAEAAHHTAEPHEGGAHGGHDDHGHGGGVLSGLWADIFSSLKGVGGGGGGGGGGHGGGHGGH